MNSDTRVYGHYGRITERSLDDDPMLNCRLIEGKDPIRVVVDSSLRIPMTARLVKTARDIRTIVACTPSADEKKIKDLQNAGVEVLSIEAKDGHVDLKKLTEELETYAD